MTIQNATYYQKLSKTGYGLESHLGYTKEDGTKINRNLDDCHLPDIIAKTFPTATAKILDFVDSITPTDYSGGDNEIGLA